MRSGVLTYEMDKKIWYSDFGFADCFIGDLGTV